MADHVLESFKELGAAANLQFKDSAQLDTLKKVRNARIAWGIHPRLAACASDGNDCLSFGENADHSIFQRCFFVVFFFVLFCFVRRRWRAMTGITFSCKWALLLTDLWHTFLRAAASRCSLAGNAALPHPQFFICNESQEV